MIDESRFFDTTESRFKPGQKQRQVKMRLGKITTMEDLVRFHQSSKAQNQKLELEVRALKQQLELVQEKRRNKNMLKLSKEQERQRRQQLGNQDSVSKSNSIYVLSSGDISLRKQTQFEIDQVKNELKVQYEIMNHLKGQIEGHKKTLPTEEIQTQKRNLQNQLKVSQVEIEKFKNKKMFLEKQYEQLEETVRFNQKESSQNGPQIKRLSEENGSLRKKISNLRQEGHQDEAEAAKVMNTLYKNKELISSRSESSSQFKNASDMNLRKTQKLKGQAPTYRNSSLHNLMPSQQLPSNSKHFRSKSQANALQIQSRADEKHDVQEQKRLTEQIERLKQQVNQISQAQMSRQKTARAGKAHLTVQIKEHEKKFKHIESIKTKKVVELNHLKAKIKEHLQKIQTIKKSKKYTRDFTVLEIEPETKIQSPLRRDYAGVYSTKNSFDDRAFLMENRKTFIKGLIVYENQSTVSKGSIVAIRGIYTDLQTNRRNFPLLPGQYLQKCKMHKLELPEDDFIKLFKVKYNMQEGRVSKIQIRSNRNGKYEFGEKRGFQQGSSHESVYAFDIGMNEYPVSLFGSFVQIRSSWYLESIGVQINDLV